MKKILLAAMFLTTTAFAQGTSTNTMSTRPDRDHAQKGVYLGYEYMNLSDIHLRYKFSGTGFNSSGYREGGTHLGMSGINVGYNSTPDVGLGFKAGARILGAMNASEYGEKRIDMIIGEGNLTAAVNSYLAGYVGLNLAKFSGSQEIEKYETQVGGQFGVSVRFSNSIAANAGYTMLNQRRSSSTDEQKETLEVLFSGFNTSFAYTF